MEKQNNTTKLQRLLVSENMTSLEYASGKKKYNQRMDYIYLEAVFLKIKHIFKNSILYYVVFIKRGRSHKNIVIENRIESE